MAALFPIGGPTPPPGAGGAQVGFSLPPGTIVPAGPTLGGNSAGIYLPGGEPPTSVGYGSTLVNGVNYPTQVPQNVVGGVSGSGDNVNPDGGDGNFLEKYGKFIVAGVLIYLLLR